MNRGDFNSNNKMLKTFNWLKFFKQFFLTSLYDHCSERENRRAGIKIDLIK